MLSYSQLHFPRQFLFLCVWLKFIHFCLCLSKISSICLLTLLKNIPPCTIRFVTVSQSRISTVSIMRTLFSPNLSVIMKSLTNRFHFKPLFIFLLSNQGTTVSLLRSRVWMITNALCSYSFVQSRPDWILSGHALMASSISPYVGD